MRTLAFKLKKNSIEIGLRATMPQIHSLSHQHQTYNTLFFASGFKKEIYYIKYYNKKQVGSYMLKGL